ncbi:hypothetical protein Hore_19460 [Halothermothrix orenii H 168]|uniref:Uncharacterized protein n=1 Tax=Halothermothrix orenii (strain H 168 / OCM 544 / DSM 9562) TaxID=373903 RepID=B8CZH4_HALOH|nr:hypothetical protein Hore_19460 [Halothermothrix orenii H 168]
MREELIEALIQVEKDARRLEEEGHKEAKKLCKYYRQKMDQEKEKRLLKARQEGKNLVKQAEQEAREYAQQLEKNKAKELKEMEARFNRIKSDVVNKYFKQITGFEGE